MFFPPGCNLIHVSASFAQTSPEAFLGYPLGTHFTPHYKIVRYFESVAQASPSMVKLQYYGQTNEGRPLIVAFVGLPENIARLDDIRKNNLRLAGMQDGTPSETTPVIVWLSYNVHGNEPSSSEAAMETLYTLLDSGNTQAREWLKNTIVVIDPCLNPDGRDRYVNWFNEVVGLHPNARPNSYGNTTSPGPEDAPIITISTSTGIWFWQTQGRVQAKAATVQPMAAPNPRRLPRTGLQCARLFCPRSRALPRGHHPLAKGLPGGHW